METDLGRKTHFRGFVGTQDYLVLGSCLPMAVSMSANDSNGGALEYRDNAT
jgi:hypothetical protein